MKNYFCAAVHMAWQDEHRQEKVNSEKHSSMVIAGRKFFTTLQCSCGEKG
jgi:hypothetical protein